MSSRMVPKVVDIIYTILLSANVGLVTYQTFDTYQTITYFLINCLMYVKRNNDHQTLQEKEGVYTPLPLSDHLFELLVAIT